MNKKLTTLLLATVLFLGSGILSVDAAAAPKATKPLADWNGADWKAYGTSLASKPAVKKMSPLDRAKYITDQVGKKYDAAGIKPNNSYFGKGRQGLGGKASGTCGDLTVNLGAALEGAGFQTGSMEVEKTSYNPFNVNRNHGAPIVVVDGKEYVFDLWYHSGAEGKFSGFKDSPFAMPKEDWKTQMKEEGYTSSTYAPPPPPPGGPLPAKQDPRIQKLIKMGATPKEAKAAVDGNHKDVTELTKRLHKEKAQAEKEAEQKAELQAKADAEAAKEQKEFSKKHWAEEDRKEELRKKRIEKEEAIARLKEKIRKSKEDETNPDEEDWTEGEPIEIPNETTVEAGEGSENQEVKEETKPSEEPADEEDWTEEEPIEIPDETNIEAGEGSENQEVKEGRRVAPPEEPKTEEEVKPEEEPEEEPEAEPEALPEPGDSVENANGSTTTTKGYVENKDGRITVEETRNPDGSVTTKTTETDRDGNIISETTYGESGEGKTTRPDNDLRDAEPKSDAEVDADTASNGANTSSSYGDRITEEQQQHSADGSSTMAQNTQMDEASNVGNQQTRDARTTRDSGGRDAQITADAAARNAAKSDRENSWGKAIGDGVEAGITEGATAMGSAFGSGAADVAIGAIFGPSKEDSDSSGDGTGKSVAAGAAAAPSSGGGSTKGKKKPGGGGASGGSSASGGGGGGRGGGGSGSGGEDGDILISTGNDIPIDGADIDDPIGVTDTSDNDDGTITIRYACGYSWTGKPPGPSRCPVCSRETVSTGSTSAALPDDEEIAAPAETIIFRDQSLVCPQCDHYPMNKDLNADIDDSFWWVSCPKCGWKKALR